MKYFTIIENTLSLTRRVWLETVILSLLLVPINWGLLEILIIWGDLGFVRMVVVIPAALFTGLSGAILYQTFDNLEGGGKLEITFDRVVKLTFSLAVVSFLVNLIVSIGTSFLIVPGIVAMTGFFLAQVTLFKEDTRLLDSLYQSWLKTDGHRLEISLLLLLVMAVSSVVIVPIFGGALYVLYTNAVNNPNVAGKVLQTGIAVVLGVLGGLALSFQRALEYTVYAELSTWSDPWLQPKIAGSDEILDLPAQPTAVLRPPVRTPIDVDPDIVFGKTENDKRRW